MAVSQTIQEEMLKEATSATPNYSIDYNDPRFSNVETDKQQALTDLEQTYAGMIGKANGFYQGQIDNLEKWGDKQIALKDEQLAFEEQKINQQKEQAHKDYLKEQSASYVDWQKQSNKYGANSEQMASAGLTGTGFSESSQVSMHNTYQMRVAMARESFERAKLNYDNLITEARLENNAAKAEIAFQTLQKSLELALEGFQYENQLLLDKSNKKIELDNMYYNRYQDVLAQINTENAIKEDIRQYNETLAWQKENAQANRDHDRAMADADRKFREEQAAIDRAHDETAVEADGDEPIGAVEYEDNVKVEQQPNGNDVGSGAASAAFKGRDLLKQTQQPPINEQSLVDLGYKGISASELADLVEKGILVMYVKNGELHFKRGVSTGSAAAVKGAKIAGSQAQQAIKQ